MPTYVYGVILSDDDDEAVGEIFEVEQGIRDAPLTVHPETGQPVRRLLCAPFIAGNWSPLKARRLTSDNNLAKRGLTKYVKTSSGYEKTVGKGPDLLPRSGR
ncbi:MAG: FmdB family zinc ribbon protein [Planctomycetaceae bacterium]